MMVERRRIAARWATLLILAACVGVGACSAPPGQACESDSDCQRGYECLSSGGVAFGKQLCVLDASVELDASHTDSGVDDTSVDACGCEGCDCIGGVPATQATVHFGGPEEAADRGMVWYTASGDITGDGVVDLIISGPATFSTMAVYVFDGAVSRSGDIDLTEADFTYTATDFDVGVGLLIEVVGDTNGDGFDDLLVTNPGAEGDDGINYLNLGGTELAESGPLWRSSDATIVGKDGALLGSSAAGIGDFNGDGYADFALGEPSFDTHAGRVNIYFGRETFPDDLDAPDLAFEGVGTESLGHSISAAGDINGDGVDDMLVGAPRSRADLGAAYLVYGYASEEVLPSTPTAISDAGVSLLLPTSTDLRSAKIGLATSMAGDLDGDGHLDMIVAGPAARTANGQKSGVVAVVFGSGDSMPSRGASIDLEAASLLFVGGSEDAMAGVALASSTDLNGDGGRDIVVGSPGADGPYGTRAGAVYIISNLASKRSAVGEDALELSAADIVIHGVGDAPEFGADLSVVTDLSGDGRAGLLVTASFYEHLTRGRVGAAFFFDDL